MPTTYGKKKRFGFSRFLPDSIPKDKKQLAPRSGPTWNESESQSDMVPQSRMSPHEDSIDEMASMLLDDTAIDQLKADPGKRLSQISIPNNPSSISLVGSQHNSKALPQLPGLLFNGDDAWAAQTATVVTAADNTNEMQFADSTDEMLQPPSQPSSNHVRNSSAPTIPRKSSKRNSARPKSMAFGKQSGAMSRKAIPKSISTPNQLSELSQPKQPMPMTTNDIKAKIEKMLKATAELKGESRDGDLFRGPLVTTKKRIRDYKVLSRVKTVLQDRLQARSSKKRHDPIRDDLLLYNASNDMETMSASGSAISSLEIGANERKNLRDKAKSKILTGCKEFPRKPISDDGNALKTSVSIDDPFSSSQYSIMPRTPTESEHRLVDNMSLDLSADYASITDLPTTPRERHHDFDSLLSSSPVAQSTPRIRLEPFEEGGKKTLKNVPADSHSLFDHDMDTSCYSDMEVDSEHIPRTIAMMVADAAKRKSSELKAPNLGLGFHQSKRIKKHPSPSKTELEGLQEALKKFSDDLPSPKHSAPRAGLGKIPTLPALAPTALAPIDPNGKLGNRRQSKQGVFARTGSMPDAARQGKGQNFASSMSHRSSQYSTQAYDDEDNMDIDELQMDEPTHDIGMRRFL